ncbi:hypothetical protein OBA28_02525 [Alphaproteobacteria bacterium]|nr:hypothetical protein [Alphaproteobacteria bacterium]
MIENSLARKIFKDFLKEKINFKNNQTLIIGIDGPTASGKTILADNLKKEVENYGRKCFVYRLDWTLISRNKRLKDLEEINSTKSFMKYESALHMRLFMVEDFLKKIRNAEYSQEKKKIILDKLYSRDDNGKINGSTAFNFDKNYVVLLEGHYTSETKLSRYIDFNIMLLGEYKVLIKRKIDRVKNYRRSNEVEDYFSRIDLPSFRNHLKNFPFGSDLIVDNSNFKKPKIKNYDFVLTWIKKNKIKSKKKINKNRKIKLQYLIKDLFSCSLESKYFVDVVHDSIVKLLEWDTKICEYLTISINYIETDVTTCAKDIIKKLHIKDRADILFDVIHTNAIHNIYKRKLPVTLGINIKFKKINKSIHLLMEVTNNSIFFRIIWDGGSKRIKIDRQLGETRNTKNILVEVLNDKKNFSLKTSLKVYTPTHFIIPSFLKGSNFNLILTDHEEENVSSVSCINELINNYGVWIRRFATFKELSFFREILLKVGLDSISIGNYLIASRLPSSNLKKRFKEFCNQWDTSFQNQQLYSKGSFSYDKICETERVYVKKFVKRNCKDFVYLDEKLYCKRDILANNFLKINKQIQKMLLNQNRLLRKRISQFILDTFPNLKVNTSKYWEDIKSENNRLINFSEIIDLQPSILSEIYLWINLRGDNSAILASNIYDIRGSSVDCYAFLASSIKNKTPIVLQASLNAIGQKENYNGKKIQGYLKPKNGVSDFISAATRAARDFFLDTGDTSLIYGIGLDHINYENDIPHGRARRFLTKSMNSGLVTHYVLDGSKKFKIKNETDRSYKRAFTPVIDYALSLIEKIPAKTYYIFDKEICAGELNYIENKKEAILPTAHNFKIFVEVFREKIKEKKLFSLLKRPILFIGNLGTTHHGSDTNTPKVEIAEQWKEKIQRYNFISAVLHGTTQTHSDYLKRSTGGCHKVNVAGDFLETFINNLPVELYEILVNSGNEKKKSLHLISAQIKKLQKNAKHKIIRAMESHCHSIQQNINSPTLTPNDISYFKYRPYKYSKSQSLEIVNSISKRLDKDKIIKNKNLRNVSDFSASMIEVPFNEFYKKTVNKIFSQGISNFHIDVGDGKFITRKIDALRKVKYLKENFKKLKIHCHLMVNAPHKLKQNNKSYIEEYISAGCQKIALHERSFEDETELISAINIIKKYNAKPGVVIETYRNIDEKLIKILIQNKIEWVVIMGVVIGYGGQIFDNKIISKINALKVYYKSINKKLLIEVDGGLTEDNIKMCIDAGADILSGWSIVKSKTVSGITKKLKKIKKICGK